jgi:hypothetical protein
MRVEIAIRSTAPTMGETDGVLKDILFDEPLDEALFSTDPPPGYKRAAENPPPPAPAQGAEDR